MSSSDRNSYGLQHNKQQNPDSRIQDLRSKSIHYWPDGAWGRYEPTLHLALSRGAQTIYHTTLHVRDGSEHRL
jgi:hypothetical protein